MAVEYKVMPETAQIRLMPAREVARQARLETAGNGLRYALWGATDVQPEALKEIVGAVPPLLAEALQARAYYFVPLALGENEEIEVAPEYSEEWSERATCHRNLEAWGKPSTFISARLMSDRFALAFEFFINVGHQAVDVLPVPERFAAAIAVQAKGEVRGETSQDSWEARRRWIEAQGDGAKQGGEAEERARKEFAEAALADALAIYMLSLALDLDYADLREREYPLLAAPALAERLHVVAEAFPPAEGVEFAIKYRRGRR